MQVLALLERIKLQDAGLAEPPPIGLRGYVPAAETAAARGYGPGGARDARPDWRDVVDDLGEGSGEEDLGSDDEGGSERGARARAAVGATSSEGGEDGEEEEEESEEGDDQDEDDSDDEDDDAEVHRCLICFACCHASSRAHKISAL